MLKFYKLYLFLICFLSAAGLMAQGINGTAARVPFGANPSYQYGIMPTTVLPSGGTYGKSQHAADAYLEWKANYTEACPGGEIRVKFDEPNRTVSEGIAYGMILSAYAADKTLFDGLWLYYRNHRNGNGVMHWRIDGCSGISGSNGATDAELDAAFALLIAENQWPDINSPYDYNAEANTLMNAIRQYEINSSGQAINGDGWGFGDNCRNPSYQSPAYYREFATKNVANASVWNGAVTGGYNLINANAHSTTGLISDWSDPNGVRNTCNPGGLGYAATNGFGYDACRNLWRMAQDAVWNDNSNAKSICNKVTTYINGRGGAGNIGGPLYQDGANYSGYAHNATFVSMFALAAMGSTNQTLLNSLYTEVRNTKDPIKNSTLSGYFGNTLRCVSLFMLTGNFWKVGTTSAREVNVRQQLIQVAHNSTFDFQNAQINNNKDLVFTIENLGFNTLTVGPAPVLSITGDASYTYVAQVNPTTLAFGASTTFTIRFRPTTTGIKTAVLTVKTDDSDEGNYTINLTGTGTLNATAPKMTVYDTVAVLNSGSNFPMGAFTTSSTGYKILKVTNTGDAPLNITGATFSNPAFKMLTPANFTTPVTVAVGGTAYLVLGYTAPASATSSSGTVTFATNDPTGSSFVLNLTANAAACGTVVSSTKILMDYDGNKNMTQPFNPLGVWATNAANPSLAGINMSPTVASYVRATTGDYDVIRYIPCGTTNFTVSATNPAINILVYSPAIGISIQCSPKKADGTDTGTDPDEIFQNVAGFGQYDGNVTKQTTKAGQWELISFDMTKIINANLASSFTVLDFMIDPLRAHSGNAANAATSARTFYLDNIHYGINPCVNDLSGVLMDFDTHNNVTLEYAVASLTGPVVNTVSGGLNTSSNIGLFTKTTNAATFDDGFRYVGCSNKIDLTTKKYISMLVYSSVADAQIQVGAKIPDGADGDNYPDDAATNTQRTVFANKWHRLYFDLSAVSVTNLPNVYALDIFFDPTDLVPNGSTFRFDDIRFESSLPCVTGIPATDVLNDFDDNRYLGVVYPGATADFNSIYTPAPAGNTTIVGRFVRSATGATTPITSVRFSACQNLLDLSPGKALISMKVYTANAGAKITMSLKTAGGVSLSDVTETVPTANTWTELVFDHSNIINSTQVAFIDILPDPTAAFSGVGSAVAARTYYMDDIKYATSTAEINVKALTSPTPTNILNTEAFNMGTVTVGDSSAAVTFMIQNNGLLTLNLDTPPADLVVGGTNAADFVVTKTPSYSTSIGALGSTGFIVKFKPTAGGARSASITINNSDLSENPYVIYLTGTAKAAEINVKQAANNILSGTGSYDFGTVLTGSSSTAITFTVESLGDDTLRLDGTPKIAISGTHAGDFTINQASTLAKVHPLGGLTTTTTFTITFTPGAVGTRSATISIANNDANGSEDPYTFTVTGTGSCPLPSAAGTVSGPVSVCSGSGGHVYSISTVGGATGYDWTLPTGASMTGSGTSITVSFGTASGSVTVTPTNTCGNGTSASAAVTVNAPVAPTITFADITKTFGDAAFNLAATSNSPGAITYTSVSSTPAGIVTVTPAGLVTINGAGTATLQASQVAGGCYLAGTKNITLTINKANRTITFTSSPSGQAGTSITLAATVAPAGGTLVFSVTNGTGTASVSGTTLTLSTAGTITVNANVAADANYNAANATQTFTITTQTVPTITFADVTKTFGDADFSMTATSNSSGAITYSVVSGTAATINSTTGMVTIAGAGTVTVQASQAANGPYAAATKTAVLTINKANRVVTITSANTGQAGSTVNLTATTTPSASISFSVTAGTGTASVSGSTLTLTTAGTVTVTATVAADANYNEGTANQSFTITAQTAPTITFADVTKTFGDAPFNMIATSNSLGAFTYSIVSGSGATINSSTGEVTITGAGTVTVQASQASNGTFAAGTKTATLTINKANRTITFTSSPSGQAGTSVTLAATVSPAGGTLVFSVTNGTGTASVSGTTLALSTAGTITVNANVAADANYNAASATQTFTITTQTVPTITFADVTKTFGDADFTMAATSNSNGAFTYSITAGGAFATINSSTGLVHINGAGSVTVQVSQAADGSFAAASKTAVLTINKANRTLSITSTGSGMAGTSITLTASVSPTGTVVFSVANGTGAATVSGTTLTLVSAGTVTVNADVAGDANYNAATASQSFTITAQPEPEIGLTVASVAKSSGDSYDFGSQNVSTAGTPVTFTINNTGAATLNITSIAISGTNQSEFSLNQTGTSMSVAAAGNTSFTITFSPTSAGTKSALVTIVNSDGNEASFQINLTGNATPATSVRNVLLKNALEVTPNPSEGIFKVNFKSGFNGNAVMIVRNALGEIVYSDIASGNAFDVNLQHLSGGVYFLEIKTEEGIAIERIIKQ